MRLRLLFRLCSKEQGMAPLARVPHDFGHLRFRYVTRVDAGNCLSLFVHGQHDVQCLGLRLVKKTLEHLDHVFHRREVIVVEDDFISLWNRSLVTLFDIDVLLAARAGGKRRHFLPSTIPRRAVTSTGAELWLDCHKMDRSVQADALVRATLSLSDASLRAHYVVSVLRAWPLETLGHALEALCQRAEQADT